MRKPILQASALLLVLTAAPGGASAQQTPASPATASQRPAAAAASQCGRGLAAFSRTMYEDGFWLSGYRRGYGWYGPVGVMGGVPPITARTPPVPATGGPPPAAADPFRGVDWSTAPVQSLRALFVAAHVLDQNGSEQVCEAVLAEAHKLYGAYVAQLRQIGVEPAALSSYRARQLALAQPVTKGDRAMRADAITGTDVRNLKDEYLGSIEDLAIDPQTGEIAYAIIGRGGFLGIGEDYVAVPWERLRVTPALDMFVLDVPEARLAAAPTVDPDVFDTDEGYARRRGEIDQFWRNASAR